MSIYSTSRTGFASSATIVANENYSDMDIGNILYESQLNDRAIFDAIVISDLRECRALKEGTMLESEVAALNEASIKTFFEKLKMRLKQFWEKIKAAFKSIIAKIALFVTRDGKKFVKEYEKQAKGKVFTKNLENCIVSDYSKLDLTAEFKGIDAEFEDAKRFITDGKLDKAGLLAYQLSSVLPSDKKSDTLTPAEFAKAVKDVVFTNKELTPNEYFSRLDSLKNILSNGKKAIAEIKKNEAKADKELKKANDKITKDEKDASKEDGKVNDHIKNISVYSSIFGVFEQVLSISARTMISCIKADMRNSRSIMVKALSAMNAKDDDTVNESASYVQSLVFESDDIVDEVLNGEVSDITPEEVEDVKDVIADADAGAEE